ncbi:MAG: TatD family hydrolase [Pseudomonadota bacterium]
MQIYDSHCHLDDVSYEKDMTSVLSRMRENGVQAAMIAGINRTSVARALALAERHPGLVVSVGIHPHDVANCTETDLTAMAATAAHPKVRAWGEIGLDFNRMYSPRDVQERMLIAQLDLADALNLPLIFHERDSDGRLIALLETHPKPGRRGVIHCFSGTRHEMDTYLGMGFHIGITGIITHKQRGAQLREQLPHIPADRILVETDAPYLTPTPERNTHRRNEPAFVKTVLLKVAEVRGESAEALAAVIWENTCGLFGGYPG